MYYWKRLTDSILWETFFILEDKGSKAKYFSKHVYGNKALYDVLPTPLVNRWVVLDYVYNWGTKENVVIFPLLAIYLFNSLTEQRKCN